MLSTQDFTERLAELAELCDQALDLIEEAHELFYDVVDPDAEARDLDAEPPPSDAWPAGFHAFEQLLSDGHQSLWEAKNVALNLVDAPPDHPAWQPYDGERVRQDRSTSVLIEAEVFADLVTYALIAAGAQGMSGEGEGPLLLDGDADARTASRTAQTILDKATVLARIRMGGEALGTPTITAAEVRQAAGIEKEPRNNA
jgi:hypothetical protein